MNRLTLILLCLSYATTLFSQEAITESNYLKEDSILWMNYQKQVEKLRKDWELMPDKRDSIQVFFNENLKKAYEENMRLAIKYASTPSGLRRLYMIRLDMPKDTLKSILNSLNIETQESYYGKNIQEHLQTHQIQEGDSIFTFPCVQNDGKPFDWNITNGKQLLILFGGLGCMGEDGRNNLKQLYEQTSKDNFMIIVYWPCSSLENLQKLKKEYPCEYLFISDFKQDASPMKIKYGTQTTPTCFLTDRQHIVKVKCTGIHMELFNKHISFDNK